MAHGSIVVARGDALDAVAPVLGALHFVLLEDHARRLGGFASGVRNIKTFNAQLIKIVQPQIKRIGQGPAAGLLRALLGQQAGELQTDIGLGHVQPGTPLFARLVYRRYPETSLA